MIMSVISASDESGINIFDYFTTLQRESEQEKPI
jgi:hypothetical protein